MHDIEGVAIGSTVNPFLHIVRIILEIHGKFIPIIPELLSILELIYYAQYYTSIIRSCLNVTGNVGARDKL